MMAAVVVINIAIIILSGENLSQQALNIVEGVLLSPHGLLLSFHASPKITIIVIVHVDRLDRADGTKRSITAAF